MSLDKSVYFICNPLKQARRDINALGVQFLTMPIRNEKWGIFGENLYIDDLNSKCCIRMNATLCCDEAEMVNLKGGFLCTAISDMAAIVNKSTFFYIGGFGEYKVSEIDYMAFAIRAFQKGFKVGCCGMVSLFQNFKYEKVCAKTQILNKVAFDFEKEFGFSIWNEAANNQKIGIDTSSYGVENVKPKVLLVVDLPGWAFDHIADELIANLSNRFTFKRIYEVDINNFADALMLGEECQIIYTFWRKHVASYWGEYVQSHIKNLGMTEKEFRKNI